ncbi:MAG: class I SAM-dependent methyltransferase [Desulfobacterales bacterium]|jgi:SAM-dependent methyltransferase|nr:class I SAM-dependent methyltransferase [Desulfobacterales bacterium]MDP6806649.1 class I SAM-dependent methyltransferase [Desulfobacterales bacterium]|tara:strand:+ start:9213 stop:9944 length:732 start_codon:yes stop_codon:yes gene_type:complete
MHNKNGLTARMEPFDSFWEGPENINKGYISFEKFYERNYLKYIPENREISILVVSCGPGYLLNVLKKRGYRNIFGIDSDPEKIRYARVNGFKCEVANAFNFLNKRDKIFDVIFAEQEINHLTKNEIIEFLGLCWHNLKKEGIMILHSLNGANPITGSEALSQNLDHYNTFTEYSLKQILQLSRFHKIRVIPLNLYVFYENPLNYLGLFLDALLTLIFRISFIFYGKSNRIFSKKIASISQKKI